MALDIFVIASKGDVIWKTVTLQFPFAKRIEKTSTLLEAFKTCAKKSMTKNFYVVTDMHPNAYMHPELNFHFDYKPPAYDEQYFHVLCNNKVFLLSKKYFNIHTNITDKEAEQFTFPDIKYIDSFDNETSRLEWLDLRGNPAVDENSEFGKVIEQEAEIFYLYVNGLYNDNKKHYKDNYPNIQIIESDNLEDAYKKALYKATREHFWTIAPDVKVINGFRFNYIPDDTRKNHVHIWGKVNPRSKFIYMYDSIKLIPRKFTLNNKPQSFAKNQFARTYNVRNEIACEDVPFDIIFLSYQETFADENYKILLQQYPDAKRVHGVKGLYYAHKRAAEIADTKMFYVVDADATLEDSFIFDYFPTIWEEDIVHVWRCKNPINNLVYGYGGVKLFPTIPIRNATNWHIDFTTSVSNKFKPMPEVSNITTFNTDPFNTFKSGFRECCKLSAGAISRQDKATQERLDTWCTTGKDKAYGKYAIAGAIKGREWGELHKNNVEMLDKINDYDFLQEEFEKWKNSLLEYTI